MTHDEIDTMPAGREMDALVAEKVFGYTTKTKSAWQDPECGGWNPVNSIDADDDEDTREEKQPCFLDTQRYWNVVQFFSTDIAAAWEVIRKLNETGRDVAVIVSSTEGCSCKVFEDKTPLQSTRSDADTAPLSICRAALKAVTSG